MKKNVRWTWLVDDYFGEYPFVRLWEGEVIAYPTLDGQYIESDLNLLSLIGVNNVEIGDWGWVDLPASIIKDIQEFKKMEMKVIC